MKEPLAAELDESVAARIHRAEAAIAGLKASFAGWVKADIDLIDAHFAAAQASDDQTKRTAELEALRRIAHNIKGQGGTFGCHGLSAAAADLDALLKRSNDGSTLAATGEMVAKLRHAFAKELP